RCVRHTAASTPASNDAQWGHQPKGKPTMTTTAVHTASQPATRWALDALHTSVGFTVRHMMITNVRGEFGSVAGEVVFDPKDLGAAKGRATIDVGSINAREAKRDEHLRSADFFGAEGHPQMVFESREVRAKG